MTEAEAPRRSPGISPGRARRLAYDRFGRVTTEHVTGRGLNQITERFDYGEMLDRIDAIRQIGAPRGGRQSGKHTAGQHPESQPHHRLLCLGHSRNKAQRRVGPTARNMASNDFDPNLGRKPFAMVPRKPSASVS